MPGRSSGKRGVRDSHIACKKCTTNCRTFHNGDPSSSLVTRFFKIMHGQDYEKVLYLPPKFSKTLGDSDYETQLEDTTGQKFDVKISYVNNVLAIKEGWPRFYQDHLIDYGYNLIFNYIKGLKGGHFIVQIYDRTALEVVKFYNIGTRQNKRFKGNLETSSQEIPFQHNDENLMDNPSSTTPVAFESDIAKTRSSPTPMDFEYLSCVTDRDVGYYEEVNRNFLFDLSSFEMKGKTSDAEKTFKIDILPAVEHIKVQVDRKGDDEHLALNRTNQTDYSSEGIVTNKSHDEPNDISNSKVQNDEKRDTSSVGNPVLPPITATKFPNSTVSSSVLKDQDQSGKPAVAIENKPVVGHKASDLASDFPTFPHVSDVKPTANIKKELVELGQVSIGQMSDPLLPSRTESIINPTVLENPVLPKLFNSSILSPIFKYPPVKQPAKIKEEMQELGEEGNGYFSSMYSQGSGKGKAPTMEMKFEHMSTPDVKTEPGISDDEIHYTPPFDAEVKSLSYLELPKSIPSVPGAKYTKKGKVVYVRDEFGRTWPILYPGKLYDKAFIGINWKRLCEANIVKLGDVCKFGVEDNKQCYYKVDIIHNGDGSS